MSNVPDPEWEDFMARYRREEAERQRRGEERARYVAPALRFFGVQAVEADFDGYGDDGTMDEPTFSPPPPAELPFGLTEFVGTICGDVLPGGWEINGGSFGTVQIDVGTGTIHLDIEWREDDEEDEYDEEVE